MSIIAQQLKILIRIKLLNRELFLCEIPPMHKTRTFHSANISWITVLQERDFCNETWFCRKVSVFWIDLFSSFQLPDTLLQKLADSEILHDKQYVGNMAVDNLYSKSCWCLSLTTGLGFTILGNYGNLSYSNHDSMVLAYSTSSFQVHRPCPLSHRVSDRHLLWQAYSSQLWDYSLKIIKLFRHLGAKLSGTLAH